MAYIDTLNVTEHTIHSTKRIYVFNDPHIHVTL
jgi:hypothetical protein